MALSESELQSERNYLSKVFARICEETERLNGEIKNKYSSIVKENHTFGEDVPILNGEVDFDEIVEIYKFNDIVEAEEKHYNSMAAHLRILHQMHDSAYFGKISFVEDGEAFGDDYYIGISTLLDKDSDFLVLDWRAPVCNLYYEYESGPCSYDCPAGKISGTLTSKRQFGIFRDKINFAFDTDVLIEDKLLCQVLSESRDKKMGNIVKSIQKEQNTAIRQSSAKNLVVFGPAGCGKTSVAMHRAAFILYKLRDSIKADNILIISPNSVFKDYISDVLPDLGEANVNITTVYDLFLPLLPEFSVSSHGDFMNTVLSGVSGNRLKSAEFKSSPLFLNILLRYASFVDKNKFSPTDIVHEDKVILSADEISRLFYVDWANMSYSQRLKRIASRANAILEEEIIQRKKEIAEENAELFSWEIEELQTKLINEEFAAVRAKIKTLFSVNAKEMYANLFKSEEFFNSIKDLASISFDEFRSMLDLDSYYNKAQLDYEDFFPLLFIKCVIDGEKIVTENPIKFIFIDEFQDIPPVGLYVMKKVFDKAAMTLVGDTNQTIDRTASIYNKDVLSLCLGSSTDIFNLKKSYRSTIEISEYASRLISDENTEFMDRHGDSVCEKAVNNEDEKIADIVSEINSARERGFKSVGIICRSRQTACSLHDKIKLQTEATLIVSDSDRYSSGTTVLPSYLSKGLEFDVVFVYDGDEYVLPDELRLYYTVCTRAMHKLIIYR